jgi:hypothetical protein
MPHADGGTGRASPLPAVARLMAAWVGISCWSLTSCSALPSASDGIVVGVTVAPVFSADSIPIVLSVTNATPSPVDVAIGGTAARPQFDVIVENEAGAMVWRRSDTPEGSANTLPLFTQRIAGNESLSFSTVWRGVTTSGTPVPSGTYRVTGAIDVGERLRTSPSVTIRVSR